MKLIKLIVTQTSPIQNQRTVACGTVICSVFCLRVVLKEIVCVKGSWGQLFRDYFVLDIWQKYTNKPPLHTPELSDTK